MKTKTILLTGLAVVLFSFTLSSRNGNHSKTNVKKNVPEESRVNKGLAMEDRNQFN